MEIRVFSLLWAMQDLYHQPYCFVSSGCIGEGLRALSLNAFGSWFRAEGLGFWGFGFRGLRVRKSKF